MPINGTEIAQRALQLNGADKLEGMCARGVRQILENVFPGNSFNNGGSANGAFNLYPNNPKLKENYITSPQFTATESDLKQLAAQGKIPPGTIVMMQYPPNGHIFVATGNSTGLLGVCDGGQYSMIANRGKRNGSVEVKLMIPREYSGQVDFSDLKSTKSMSFENISKSLIGSKQWLITPGGFVDRLIKEADKQDVADKFEIPKEDILTKTPKLAPNKESSKQEMNTLPQRPEMTLKPTAKLSKGFKPFNSKDEDEKLA